MDGQVRTHTDVLTHTQRYTGIFAFLSPFFLISSFEFVLVFVRAVILSGISWVQGTVSGGFHPSSGLLPSVLGAIWPHRPAGLGFAAKALGSEDVLQGPMVKPLRAYCLRVYPSSTGLNHHIPSTISNMMSLRNRAFF